jgi:hypothetical protein
MTVAGDQLSSFLSNQLKISVAEAIAVVVDERFGKTPVGYSVEIVLDALIVTLVPR